MTSKYLIGAIKITIYFIIAFVSTYIFVTLFHNQPLPFAIPNKNEPMLVLQNIVLEDTITSLDIEWYVGGVEITKSTDNRIHIVEKSSSNLDENKLVKPRVSNNTLYLHSRNKNNVNFLFYQSPMTYLELQLPDQDYSHFKLYMTSGKTNITDFFVSKLDLDMTSGNLHLNNLKSEDMNITMTSGNASFNQVHTNNLELGMTSGNASFTGTITNDLDVEMTSGDLDLDTSSDSPNSLKLEMTSGSATLTLSENEGFKISLDKSSGHFRPDSKMTQINDELYEYMQSTVNYTVEMTSGSLSINLK